MCGVSGFLATQKTSLAYIEHMNTQIKHRGPDDEGYLLYSKDKKQIQLFSGNDTPEAVLKSNFSYSPKTHIKNTDQTIYPGDFALGHRRLSILDVSPAGHQPLTISDGRYWISYNGEVYNYVEIKTELENLGITFNTHSDTEVILKAYSVWGEDCLNKFNGMFAFLILDQEKQTVFIARDRFGVKPLYYYIGTHGVAFASEIKQFTKLPGWRAVVNGQRAYDFLNWSILDHTDETLFQNVFHLKPSHSMSFTLDELSQFTVGSRLPQKKWYTLRPQKNSLNYKMACQHFKDLFTNATQIRLRSDVPIGSCLSGGLDSSSIVSVANGLLQQQQATHAQKTFSACSTDKSIDETKWMNIVNEKTKAESYKVTPTPSEILSIAEKTVWHQDEPFGSTSIFAQWFVFEEARKQNVVVMLDGQGADEQLAGYDGYLFSRLAHLLKALKWVSFVSEWSQTHWKRGFSHKQILLSVLNYFLPNSFRNWGRLIFGKSSIHSDFFNLNILKAKATDPMFNNGAITTSLQKMSISQLTASNLQMLLHWEDRDSMAHSIESRLPFLDYRVVEFVLGLPDDYKLKNGLTKRILRDSLTGILPDEIRNRLDKVGFATAEKNWMTSEAQTEFKQLLQSSLSASQGILNTNLIELFEDMVSGKKPFNYMIWRSISFGIWMKTFDVNVSK